MSEWISVDGDMPICEFEYCGDWDDFDGYVSQSVDVTDGYKRSVGHYRDDGVWIVYKAEHDFQVVDPDEITHWAPLRKLPKDIK
tara:strand:- start:1453 stop:1704 length:252 start_codon:yes stop_codon:yes gene_type:complete